MQHRVTLFWFVFACIFLGSINLASAQAKQDVVSFTANGQTDLIRFPESDAAHAATIQAAVATIVPVYENFWNADGGSSAGLRLFIDAGLPEAAIGDPSSAAIQSVALPVPAAPWTGAVEAAKTNVCMVQVFADPNLYATPERLQFELALDLAQCYLLYYTSPPANPPDWWFKGLTYWMAVQVYPPPPAVLQVVQRDFFDNSDEDLTTAGDEALYFWEYVLGQGIPVAQKAGMPSSLLDTVNGLKKLPGTPTFFTPVLFYRYARALQANQLEWQPKSDEFMQDASASSLPADVDLELETNSIALETLALPVLDPDQGILIQAEGLNDNSELATIVVEGQDPFPLSDTSGVQVCNPPQSLMIIAGRGPVTATAGAGLTVTKVEHCGPAATPEISYAEAGGLPACVVGTWNVHFPFMEQTTQFTAGTWQYTFNSDGSLTIAMDGLTMKNKANLSIVVTFTVAGNVSLEADVATPRRYNITQWTSQLQPGGSVVETTSDGMQIDISQTLNIMNTQLNSPPVYLTCESDDSSNPVVALYATGGGQTYEYDLTRAS